MDIDFARFSADFDSAIPRFDSWRPSQSLQGFSLLSRPPFRLQCPVCSQNASATTLNKLPSSTSGCHALKLGALDVDTRSSRRLMCTERHDLGLGQIGR